MRSYFDSVSRIAATVSWIEYPDDAEHRVSIASVDDLIGVLDKATARADELGQPFTVVLKCRPDESLGMIVGHEKSLLTWIREDSDDLEVLCGYTKSGGGPLQRWTEVVTAREALRQYYSTGALSEAVRWVSE